MKWTGAAPRSQPPKQLLLAGHPDIEGLCMALADWSAELRILETEGPPPDRGIWLLPVASGRMG